ncbi:RNB domain-containing ribonuclease [Propioniciclava tarda]|uniref:RNB domain-containing ribonuclease n=1 Tax=Propioniciclava tarda TaxID=433330 RepID=A0A4Q9KJG7_PROTD|nr:RNB domain-containing ribonuclease [Propioniciclava tarda]TBT94295.1 RNB domain-containing ribonuclease [Propioniciclava tarda]SMO73912.1 Exoribonuclease R [Propioniciclava tarda]
MPALHFAAAEDIPEALTEGVARLREALGVPSSFPDAVLAEAEAAASAVVLPEADRTDIEFVTIDPEGSKDLDQALHIERSGDGYVVHYAIAEVAAFVRPGGAIDAEAHARGETLYAPSLRTPLHPPVLSEGAASLLPGVVRPALLWEITLDAAGAMTSKKVSRARVQSREQLTYEGVQAALDGGTASESLQLLKVVGQLRQAQEVARGGVSLSAPEQVVLTQGGTWELAFRTTLPVEDWNAQISLLTGMAAAELMLGAKIGILRTLPPARQGDIDRLRHVAKGLRLTWPGSMPYAEFVRSLDPAVPGQAAMLNACTRLFRGAGYAAFDGTVPEQRFHAALAVEYAHCTAPLRRLVDRYAGEVCLSICSGQPVPDWVRTALPGLPATMESADIRAKKYERGIVDLVEALVMQGHLGQTFTGVVIELDQRGDGGVVQVASPAVAARVKGKVALGHEVQVRLEAVDLVQGTVLFSAL